MSQELNKTTKEIMDKIHQGQIKMRPKYYFIIGYILTILGVVFSFITSIFFIGLTRFMIRSHGPMAGYRLEQLLSSFSWWIPLLAILGLVFGILILRKYDFSYKINFKLFVIGLIASMLIAGFIIDMTGLNEFWARRGGGRGAKQFYRLKNLPIENYNK